MIVYGNGAFQAAFGVGAVGLPARESMLDLPPEAFALFDAVFSRGRPLARWIERSGTTWRLTAAPRSDPETGEVCGVAFHLRAEDDVPLGAPPDQPD